MMGLQLGAGMSRGGMAGKFLKDAAAPQKVAIDFREGVTSAAATMDLGEHFQYAIPQPVSLPRQKSALIPIVNEPVIGNKKVSIYNEGVHAKFPLLGLQLKNSTALHVNQGPVTVFEGGSYAGRAICV